MTDFLQDFDKDYAAPVHEFLDGAERVPPEWVAGELENGEDLTAGADGGAPPVPAAPGPGGNKLTVDGFVELVHMGRVHRDKRGLFHHAGQLSDLDPKALENEGRAHGVMFRAAVEREVVLVGGMLRSMRMALDESFRQRGVPAPGADGFGIGSIVGLLGDLVGGAGGAATRPAPEDLNPFIQQVKTTAGTIDTVKLDYKLLHEGGEKLHEVRASYRKYLADKFALMSQKSDATGGAGGLLSGLPGMPDMPRALGFIFELLQKWPFVADEFYLRMLMQCHIAMGPAIEAACSAMTIDSLRKRRAPIYSSWWRASNEQAGAGSVLGSTGIGAIDSVLAPVDSAMTDAVDFLSLPVALAPGSPFVDQAFMAASPTGWLGSQTQAVAKIVAGCFTSFFGEGMPEFIKDFVTHVATIHADFLREIYTRLLGPPGRQPILTEQLVEAARLHLVSKLIDGIIGSAGLAGTVQNALAFSVQGLPLNPLKGIIDRIKELLAKEVVPYIEPAIPFAMNSLAGRLNAAQSFAMQSGSHSMEVYLAELPAAHALLFQNVFFPFWDKLVGVLFSPVNQWLTDEAGPIVDKVADDIGIAKGYLDDVRSGMLKAQKLYEATKKPLTFDAAKPGDPFKDYEDALAAEVTDADPSLGPPMKLDPWFPRRNDKASAAELTPSEVQAVPAKWKPKPKDGGKKDGDNGGGAK